LKSPKGRESSSWANMSAHGSATESEGVSSVLRAHIHTRSRTEIARAGTTNEALSTMPRSASPALGRCCTRARFAVTRRSGDGASTPGAPDHCPAAPDRRPPPRGRPLPPARARARAPQTRPSPRHMNLHLPIPVAITLLWPCEGSPTNLLQPRVVTEIHRAATCSVLLLFWHCAPWGTLTCGRSQPRIQVGCCCCSGTALLGGRLHLAVPSPVYVCTVVCPATRGVRCF